MIVPKFTTNLSFLNAGFCNAQESLKQENLLLMNQVHSADVIILTAPFLTSPSCDAFVTQEKGLKLTIKTADCAPVLFVDTEKRIIGAAHAGWKGAFQGILENTILAMLQIGAHIDNIHVAIGPHLTQKSFQVSDDFLNLFPKTEHHFFHSTNTSIYFDFTAYLQHRLQRLGLTHIETYALDTFFDSAYNSYRREPNNSARQYSFIELK